MRIYSLSCPIVGFLRGTVFPYHPPKDLPHGQVLTPAKQPALSLRDSVKAETGVENHHLASLPFLGLLLSFLTLAVMS